MAIDKVVSASIADDAVTTIRSPIIKISLETSSSSMEI